MKAGKGGRKLAHKKKDGERQKERGVRGPGREVQRRRGREKE